MNEMPHFERRAKKSLGQHFLFDKNLTRKIARQAGDLTGRTVIEIGPGPGGLTEALLETPLRQLILIEKDARFAQDWRERAANEQRLIVHEADALSVDETALLARPNESKPAFIISNLPYNVGTPLLIKWLKAGTWRGEMLLMFQLEVAERICAAPRSKAYGRLSVIAQSRAEPRLVMHVPASAFTPPPKVDSAVVSFGLLPPESFYEDIDTLEALTSAAFGQRRKMLRQSLKTIAHLVGISPADLTTAAEIAPTARPEELSPQDFRRLASIYAGLSRAHIDSARAETPI